MPKAIKPCTFSIRQYVDVIPEGYVDYTGIVPAPEEQHLYLAICDPPYIRLKTDSELAASEAIPGSARHRIKRNIEKKLRRENK